MMIVEVWRVSIGLLLLMLILQSLGRCWNLLLTLFVVILRLLRRKWGRIVSARPRCVGILMLRVLMQLRLFQVDPLVRPLDPGARILRIVQEILALELPHGAHRCLLAPFTIL